MKALTVPSVIAGEAVSGSPEERWNDMVHIASVISNRAKALGVTPAEVIANSTEFSAYNNRMPAGTEDLIGMAEEAMQYVQENGPVTNATFYATPAAVDNLPGGLSFESETAGHQYFSDPQNRSIGTALGQIQPNQYAYAQDLTNVPTPYGPEDLTSNGLLSAFQPTSQAQAPFDAVTEDTSARQPGEWGVINGVAPAPYPTMNPWADMAAAMPVQAPMQGLLADPAQLGSDPSAMTSQRAVTPTQYTSSSNGFADLAAAGPFGGDYASAASRMGVSEPGFDPSRFDGFGVSTAQADASRFASSPKTSRIGQLPDMADMSRMPALIDPMTNTQSFLDVPATSPQLGLLSPDLQTQQTRTAVDYGLLTPTSLASVSPQISTNLTGSPLAGQPMQQNGFVSNFPSAVANNTFEAASIPAPDLQTVQVPDQPNIASVVEGPATQSALDQQREQQTSMSAPTPSGMSVDGDAGPGRSRSTLGQRLSRALNPGTLTGGLLGGLALGPVGGIIGGLLGNSMYNDGGITGLLGSDDGFGLGAQIPGGMANISAIYGGQYEPGTFAVANNGAQIGALPGGWTSYTNKYGVTNLISPTGQQSAYFGPSLSPGAQGADESGGGGGTGGLFGGLFG